MVDKHGSALIILAGGVGSRFKSEKPKQLAILAGRTILEHTIANIAACDDIKQIIVVARASIKEEAEKIAANIAPDKIVVVEGGVNRLESTRAGVAAVAGPPETKILIHDGVRPFLNHSIIRDCLSSLDRYEAIDVAIPSADTLIRVADHDNVIGEIPDRSMYRRGQTPQGFWLGKFRSIFDAIPDLANSTFTDDCGMYLSVYPNAGIGIVEGAESNIKITHPIDLFLAEQLIISGHSNNELEEHAVDLSSKVVVVFGGSSGLGKHAKGYLEERGITVYSASRSEGCDISDVKQIDAFLNQVAREAGKIDIVINSAGILQISKLAKMSEEQIDEMVMINYTGALNVARLSYPYLKETEGQLILVSSSSYYRGRADYSVYSSSKAAIVNMTQALAEEWSDDGINVNCIVPRRANTPMRWAAFPGEDPATLLEPERVSSEILKLLKSGNSGLVNHVY